MPDVEGIGEFVTGAAVARAVEPAAGEAGGHTHERNCLNCGTRLAGEFCHACGQHAHVHRTIPAWWHDFMHSVLHLDGKFLRTLPMLAWRPGDLTRRYAHGQRASFVSPLALFLFTVFLMFAAFSLIGGPFDSSGTAQRVEADIRQQQEVLAKRVETLEKQQKSVAENGLPTEAVDAQLADARKELKAIEALRPVVIVPNAAPEGETRTLDLRRSTVATGVPWLDAAIAKAQKNPALLFYKLKSNGYKFSWALIPLSLPFVWVLFLHRRRYRHDFTGYDHLVFVTYSIAFMSLALIAYVLIDAIGLGDGLIGSLFLLIPPAHVYRQLRGAYSLSRVSAAWRTLVLMIFAGLALLLFLLLLLAIGVMG